MARQNKNHAYMYMTDVQVGQLNSQMEKLSNMKTNNKAFSHKKNGIV